MGSCFGFPFLHLSPCLVPALTLDVGGSSSPLYRGCCWQGEEQAESCVCVLMLCFAQGEMGTSPKGPLSLTSCSRSPSIAGPTRWSTRETGRPKGENAGPILSRGPGDGSGTA